MSSTWPTKSNLMWRVRGSRWSARLEILGHAADVAPLGLHEHVRGALELVALDGDWAERPADLAVGAERDGLARLR